MEQAKRDETSPRRVAKPLSQRLRERVSELECRIRAGTYPRQIINHKRDIDGRRSKGSVFCEAPLSIHKLMEYQKKVAYLTRWATREASL